MNLKIDNDFIISFTGNASTVANGRSLAKSGFQALHKSPDGSLLFGECKGSGKNPYSCSVDFTDEEKPIPRCSCPSRQIPCKHVAGLLIAYASGSAFTESEIPQGITEKRDKIKVREEKKAAKAENPESGTPKAFTKAKAAAAIKKCKAQLEGLALGEKILRNITLGGLHSIDKKNEKLYLEQVKELGNYYISGIQAAFVTLLSLASEAQKEQVFTAAVDQAGYTYALLKKAKAHLGNKIKDYEAFPDMTETAKEATLGSAIEEQMGYAWKLSELKEHGRYLENAVLIQVAFDCLDDPAKKEFTDEGIWLSLTDGGIYKSYNYRPYKAQKYIKEEDSFFPILETSELFIYPGEKNPRARWEGHTQRDLIPEDLKKAKAMANADFAAVIKQVKGQIKNPLSDKSPIFALTPQNMVVSDEKLYSIVDGSGVGIPLKLSNFAFLLERLPKSQIVNQTMICRFRQDMETGRLEAAPLAIVTDTDVMRLSY